MATNRKYNSERAACRGTVETLRRHRQGFRILLPDGSDFYFDPDAKLMHDIALSVQDYFRRTGKDYRRKAV